MMTTVKAIAIPFTGSEAISFAITAVKTTVIGPVGSEIRVGEPPNNAANKPTKIAPYKPASAPAPEATPKANAIGSAITAAVTPPKTSPRLCLKLISFNTCISLQPQKIIISLEIS